MSLNKTTENENASSRIVGISPVDYDRDGRRVHGVNLHVLSPFTRDGCVGFQAAQYYISGRSASEFRLGPIVTLTFEPTRSGARCTGVVYQ